MKKRLSEILACLMIFSTLPVFAQSYQFPGAALKGSEKKPTSKDPRYLPPLVPDYLQKKLDPEAGLLISPTGSFNLESIFQSRIEAEKAKSKRNKRFESRDYSESADSQADRYLFERSILRQFGVDDLSYAPTKRHYHETPARRFQIVFTLSLPFTFFFSYGIAALAKNSTGKAVVLDGPETAAFVTGAFSLSGLIAWYDNYKWNELKKKGSSGRKKKIESSLLERDAYIRNEMVLLMNPGYHRNHQIMQIALRLTF